MDITYTNSDNKIVVEIEHRYNIKDVVQFRDMTDGQFGTLKIGIVKDIYIGTIGKSNLKEALDSVKYIVNDYNNQNSSNPYSLDGVYIIKKIEV